MLYYLAFGEYPGRKAHTIQMIRMCEAFSEVGQPTTLVHPSHGNGQLDFDDIAEYYGVNSEFQIQTIPSFSGRNNIPGIPTFGEVAMSFWLIGNILIGRIGATDIIYARHLVPTYICLKFLQIIPSTRRPTVVFEQHQTEFNHRFINNDFYQLLDGVVFISDTLKDEVLTRFEIESSNVHIAHDGVRIEEYENLTKSDARKRLGWNPTRPIVMYTGHLYPEKNVEQLVEIAPQLDAEVYIVGGFEEDIDRIRNHTGDPNNVTFTGFIEPSNIPLYQMAADILILMAAPSSEYYSPLKLFEYMATGNAVIAAGPDSYAEIIEDGINGYLVECNPDALFETVQTLIDNPDLRTSLGENALDDVMDYTWEERAGTILTFIDGQISTSK